MKSRCLLVFLHLAVGLTAAQGQDLMRMRNGDVYQGAVAVERVEIQTAYGNLGFPRAQLASIRLPGERGQDATLITTRGDRYSGQLGDNEFQITPQGAGELKVGRPDLMEIRFDSPAAADTATVPDEIAMRNQDRFHAKVGTAELSLKTSYGELSFKLEEIQSLEMDRSLPLHATLTLKAGKGSFTGRLGLTEIALKTSADQELTLALEKVARIDFGGSMPGKVFKDLLRDGSYGPEMVVIPPGQFSRKVGVVRTEDVTVDDSQQVSLAKPFALGRFEVTFEEYDRFCTATGRPRPADEGWGRGSRPALNLAWKDAKAYVEWLAMETGQPYRLPSEAEWEYAARAGTAAAYWWGDEVGAGRANCDGCGSRWDGEQTAPVGSFRPNPYGLHDTAGNVWEWTADCWADDYQNAPLDGTPYLGGECLLHVRRGGAWDDAPAKLLTAHRSDNLERRHPRVLGMRVARDL